MNLKDKIILVYYIGISGIEGAYVNDYLTQVRNAIAHDRDESVEEIFIPIPNSNEVRVECINPVLVSDEKYAEVETLVNSLRMEMEKTIEKYSENHKNNKKI